MNHSVYSLLGIVNMGMPYSVVIYWFQTILYTRVINQIHVGDRVYPDVTGMYHACTDLKGKRGYPWDISA